MNEIGFKELRILAKRYGFDSILDFAVWIEDNNLVDALGIRGDYEEEDEIKEDKNSRIYKAKVLALEILSLPEVQKELKESDNISLDKWKKWARKAKKR